MTSDGMTRLGGLVGLMARSLSKSLLTAPTIGAFPWIAVHATGSFLANSVATYNPEANAVRATHKTANLSITGHSGHGTRHKEDGAAGPFRRA